MKTMKAAFFEKTGTPDVIQYGDLPTPEPKAGEMCVRIAATSLNPIDTYIRSGAAPMNLPFPFIPGCDFAGTVESVGAGVKGFQSGDRVWGSNQGLLGRQGTFAEFACVHEDFVYATPTTTSDEDAAACALVGITAHLGLFQCAKLRPGETVFVNGGTGGVGAMVVQMARAAGAHAVTTVGSPEKRALANQLGASLVIDYKSEDVNAKIKEFTAGKGVQVWFETQPPSDLDKTVEAMSARGRIIVMAGRAARPAFPNGPFYVKGLSLTGFAMFNMTPAEQRICADDINRWLAEGKLRSLIGKRSALQRSGGGSPAARGEHAEESGDADG